MEETQEVEVKKEVTGHAVLSFTKPTPAWATWIFRVVFILTGVATFIVLGDNAIDDSLKTRLALYLKGIDMAVWAMTRAIGIDVNRDFNVSK
jgi:hypothetical protein